MYGRKKRLTTAIYHYTCASLPGDANLCFADCGGGGSDVFRGVVGPAGATAEDKVHIGVTACPYDGRKTLIATELGQSYFHCGSGRSKGEKKGARERKVDKKTGIQEKKYFTCTVTPINACGFAAARIASTATPTLPSVPFLKPIGKDEPLGMRNNESDREPTTA